MPKLKKFFTQPGAFWRDYLLKRYPNSEYGTPEDVYGKLLDKQSIPGFYRHHELDPYPIEFPIDLVYTWVDGSDSEWRKKKNAVAAEINNYGAAIDKRNHGDSRFECRGELRYSLRSVEAFTPWVRKIFFVTDSQVPDWLDVDHPKIEIVDHKTIIDEQYLPTFNSHVIEANLHKIPDLAEHYIYLNDDVMFSCRLPPEHFFSANGNAHVFIASGRTPLGEDNMYDTPVQKAAKNVRRLIQDTFGKFMIYKFAHTFHPQLKSVREEIAGRYKAEIDDFMNNRFRRDNDLPVATYLFPNYAYLSGRASISRTNCAYLNIWSPDVQSVYATLLKKRDTSFAPFSICVNDVIETIARNQEAHVEAEYRFLESYYPQKSSFEL